LSTPHVWSTGELGEGLGVLVGLRRPHVIVVAFVTVRAFLIRVVVSVVVIIVVVVAVFVLVLIFVYVLPGITVGASFIGIEGRFILLG
jgi:hypothetical protein